MVGLTQHQLGQAIGIRFQQIQKYESGANRIAVSRLWEMARALNVSVSFFYAGLDDIGDGVQACDSDHGLLQSRETFDLVRAYYGLDEEPRRRLLELAKALSGDEPRSAAPT
jgi:transcriptional regulator with XRE-family HTH domain